MTKLKKYVSTLLICLFMLNCIGCWSYNEVNERVLVTTVGIDYDSSNEKYKITIKVSNAKPSEKGVNIIPEVVTVECKSIFEAIRKSAVLFGKKTYWSHLKSVIVSEKVASENILHALDFFNRDAEVRQDCNVYIAEGISAEEMVRLEAKLQNLRDFRLSDSIKTQKYNGLFPELQLIEFTSDDIKETIEPMLPILRIYDDDEVDIKIQGSAVFLKGKYIGNLNANETLYSLLIRNKVENPVIALPICLKKEQTIPPTITLEINKSKSKIKADIDEGKIKISIDVKIDAAIGEVNTKMNFLTEKEINTIIDFSQREIADRILKVVKKVQQEYKADIFGFGKAVEIKAPKFWDNIKENWSEEFSALPIKVNVKVNIDSTGKSPSTLERGK
ncbi:Ger(x)C family spore germination protein [Desnuesiella massiliensis]|uniref:Ger(x)C family spore germination protein n=1 Tax=Desnuesiella massiliensis TaxID=1650662 RepID=UPI0006E2AC99|nr:Ger(x)C family spore germination protein [Desnuesiella massiliensis]